MTIDQVVPLTNGLSVTACAQALAIERARVTRVTDRAVEMSFRLAGTDFAPRFTLPRRRLASASYDEFAAVVRRVATKAVGCH
jgi:hypothetical protein